MFCIQRFQKRQFTRETQTRDDNGSLTSTWATSCRHIDFIASEMSPNVTGKSDMIGWCKRRCDWLTSDVLCFSGSRSRRKPSSFPDSRATITLRTCLLSSSGVALRLKWWCHVLREPRYSRCLCKHGCKCMQCWNATVAFSKTRSLLYSNP